MSSCIVLLSSGLDSTVNLCRTLKDHDVSLAITFDYGQRAVKKEVEFAAKICQKYEILHKVIELNWLKELSNSSLTNKENNVPTGNSVSIDDFDTSMETAKSVWVPNRNGVFLNIAAAFADEMKVDYLVPGFNLEEATTFPDNSKEFMDALDNSFSFSTNKKVKLKCYTHGLNKTEIVKLGKELSAPFELMWPCYFDGDERCGECESCQRFDRAVNDAK